MNSTEMSLNSNVLKVFKVIDEIMNRLFNHKPFIFGEIRFIVKELEQKPNESDFNELMATLNRLTDLKENKINLVINSCHRLDDRLNGCVDSVHHLMQEIVGLESIESIERKKALKSRRDERNEEMIALIEVSKQKITQIDGQFEEKDNDLRLFYKDLEIKLNL